MIITRKSFLRGEPLVGRNEIQRLTVSATGGTFTMTLAGQTSAAIAYNANAATLETALELLSTVNDVEVYGGPGDETGSTPYYIEFQGTQVRTNMVPFTTDPANLTGGDGTALIATVQHGAPVSATVGIIQVTAPTVNDVVGDYTFANALGQQIEVIPCYIHNLDDDTAIFVKMNAGSTAIVHATEWHARIPFGEVIDITRGVLSVQSLSVFFPTGHAGVVLGTHWHIEAYDPAKHVH